MAKIYGQLEKAQIENLTSDPSAGVAGRIWWRTDTGFLKTDDGTNIRALLRNDANLIIGNNGTAANNIRLHRGASAVLQFVLGNDATAEGTLSTNLAQISAKVENYANIGSLPAAGNAGRIAFVTGDAFYGDNGSTWTAFAAAATALDSSDDLQNFSLAVSQSGGTLTVELKTKSGADASAGSPIKIAFRNSSATSTAYNIRSITGASSDTALTGSVTLGGNSGVEVTIYVYLFDDAGTLSFGYSLAYVDQGELQSSSTSSSSANVIYQASSLSTKPVRCIGAIKVTNTAGAWGNPTAVSILPLLPKPLTFFKGGAQTSNSTTTSATYADPSNQPSLTFTPLISGVWEMEFTGNLQGSTAGNSYGMRVTPTAGSPRLLANHEATIGVQNTNQSCSMRTYYTAYLTAGTSYTFVVQAKAEAGTATIGNNQTANGNQITARWLGGTKD